MLKSQRLSAANCKAFTCGAEDSGASRCANLVESEGRADCDLKIVRGVPGRIEHYHNIGREVQTYNRRTVRNMCQREDEETFDFKSLIKTKELDGRRKVRTHTRCLGRHEK